MLSVVLTPVKLQRPSTLAQSRLLRMTDPRLAAQCLDQPPTSPVPLASPFALFKVSCVTSSATLDANSSIDEPSLATSEDEMEHVVESAAYIEPALALKAESVLHPGKDLVL